jgi:hypothetical protein
VYSLKTWLELLDQAPRRSLLPEPSDKVEWLLFTDGHTPDARHHESGPSMIGAVLFKADGSVPPRYLSAKVPASVEACWNQRATQISMVETLAPVVAFRAWKKDLNRGRTIVLIDNSGSEGALVKGYSSRDDVCELVSHFWMEVASAEGLVYIDRVPTDSNPADMPSRPDKCSGLERFDWVRAHVVEWPLTSGEGNGRAWVNIS